MAGDAGEATTIEELIASGAIVAHKDGNYGSSYPRVEEFGPEGVPFLTAKSLREGYVDIAGAPRLGDARADELTFGFVQTDDVLLSHNATIGRVAVVPQHKGRLLVGTSLTYFRLNPQKLLPRYLAVYFAGADFQNQLIAVMSHSTRNQVPVTAQRKLHVIVPPLAEQKAIAAVLGALDDKIELNRRMNATLEAMARALFQSWFVDFDPVRAKLDPAPAGPTLDPATAALFPASFDETAAGHIPHGWEVCPLSEKIQLLSGGTPKTSEPTYWDGAIPWYSVRDAPSETDVWVIHTDKHVTKFGIANSAAQIFPEKTTIISARGTVGKLALTAVPMAMNQSCYGVRGITGYGDYFTYYSLREATAQLQQRTHGTVFDTITTETFKTLDCIFPTPKITAAFDKLVEPLLGQIRANLHQSRTLATLRDTLLPKLLSGELSAAKTTSRIGEAL
jgi:type I restriction enzyme, S subunit